MNELLENPSKKNIPEKSNIHNNKLMLLIPLLLLFVNFLNSSSIKKNTISASHNKPLHSINIKNLNEKINILRKIGPYFPESIIQSFNSIIFITDKLSKVVGLIELITSNKHYTPIVAIENLNSKERINGILSTITTEISDEKFNNVKPILDLALNADKYKSVINAMSNLNTNKSDKDNMSESLNEAKSSTESNKNKPNQIEDIMAIAKTLLGNNEKVNQIDNIMNLLKPIIENKNSNTNKDNQINDLVNTIKPLLANNTNISNEKASDMMKIIELLGLLNSKEKNKDQ